MYTTVNIEEGLPRVDEAIRRATRALHSAKREQVVAVKLIHGYGSSGSGGRIRTELRSYLERQVRRGEVRMFVPGERLDIFDAQTRALIDACPPFARDSDLNRHNNGITVVLL